MTAAFPVTAAFSVTAAFPVRVGVHAVGIQAIVPENSASVVPENNVNVDVRNNARYRWLNVSQRKHVQGGCDGVGTISRPFASSFRSWLLLCAKQ